MTEEVHGRHGRTRKRHQEKGSKYQNPEQENHARNYICLSQTVVSRADKLDDPDFGRIVKEEQDHPKTATESIL